MISDRQRRFLDRSRVGHLATAGQDAAPHVIPVCFGVTDATLYIAIDGKPKRTDRPLRRLANLAANPAACFIADHYDEDWQKLGWVMLRGPTDILDDGTEHATAQAMLTARYPQLAAMDIASLPVIALRVARATEWGTI